MLAPFNKLGLILSYQCNSKCRHCLYACSNKLDKWLALEDAKKIMGSISGTYESPWGFHLGGGEPFLNFPRLLEIAKMAFDMQIPFTNVETNAGWCTDEDDIKEKLLLLKEAGIRSILISSSPFHAEFIPQERVRLLWKVAREIFEEHRVILFTEEFFDQIAQIGLKEVIPLENYVKHYGPEAAVDGFNSIDSYQLTFGGRAAYSIKTTSFTKKLTSHFKNHSCKRELLEASEIHIDSCCNTIPGFCSGISLGDARKINRWYSDFHLSHYPILKILTEEGPYGLYLFAQDRFNYQATEVGYYDKCQLCGDIRKYIFYHTQVFKELAPHEFYTQLLQETNDASGVYICA